MLTKEYCPQCGRESDSSRVRLVQDSCGHKKCRECLLSEETGCLSCSNSTNPVFTDLRPVPQPQHPDIIADQITDAVIPSIYTEETPHSDSIPQASLDVMKVSEQQDSSTTEPLGYQNTLDDRSADSQDEEIPENNATVKKRPTYGLKEHIVFTPGDPPKYFCKKCQKAYDNRKAARYHNYCGASNTEKPHTCNVCGKGFVTKGHFNYHMKSHTGILPHLCKSCGKGFKQLSKLKRHSKSHEETSEKPFKCELCEKSFGSKHTLNEHKLSHSGSYALSCPICDKKLSSKSCLRKHQKLHGEPIFKCNHCGKKFSVKWSLDVHMKSHVRERKFKCKLCNRAFKILSDMKRHAVVHQEDGEWDCQICNLVFRRRDNLIRHFKNIHPESKLNVKHGKVKISEKESNEMSKPEESAGKAPASISQAVSVIRGPVIQKAQSVLTHGCLKSLETVAIRVEENLRDNWQVHSMPDQACENMRTVSQNEFNPSNDQNYQRESVVCHSGASGIVHYESSALDSVCEVNNSLSQNERELNVWGTNSSSEAEDYLHYSNANALQRPRVIIEKNPYL